MKTETFEGTVENYQGKAVSPVVKYDGVVEVPGTVTEAKETGNWPNDSDILKMITAKLVTAAKASAYQAATKSLKDAYENSDDFKRNNLIKAALAAGFTQAEAEGMAASKLG